MPTFDQTIIDLINANNRANRLYPLVLGGVPGYSGGGGSPPGGYVGLLPQGRVAGDYSEAEVEILPESGATLVDNLNKIRYRIKANETEIDDLWTAISGTIISGSYLSVSVSGVPFVFPVTGMDFFGDFILSEEETGVIRIDLPEKESLYSEEIENVTVQPFTTTYKFVAGSLEVFVNGLKEIQATISGGEDRHSFRVNQSLFEGDSVVAMYRFLASEQE